MAQGHPAVLPKGCFLRSALGFNPSRCGGGDWDGGSGTLVAHSQIPLGQCGSCSEAGSPSVSFVCEGNKEARSSALKMSSALCCMYAHTHAHTNTHHSCTPPSRCTWTHIPGPRLVHSSLKHGQVSPPSAHTHFLRHTRALPRTPT